MSLTDTSYAEEHFNELTRKKLVWLQEMHHLVWRMRKCSRHARKGSNYLHVQYNLPIDVCKAGFL